MPGNDDTTFIRQSIELSHEARRKGNEPYGAVLVSKSGTVLAHGENDTVTRGDPTGHAESNAIREAAERHGPEALVGATMYASGEPCPMCAAACFHARIGRIVFAVSGATIRTMAPADRPRLALTSHEVASRATPPMVVDGPVAEEEGKAAFEGFF